MPFPFVLLIAVAGGLVAYAAFPGAGTQDGVWVATPVGIGMLLLAARGQRPLRGALLGLAWGLAFFVPHVSWAGEYLGPLPWLSLAGLQAAFVAAAGSVLPLAWRVPAGAAGTATTTTAIWLAQEAARSRVPFGGFPWGRLAFSQADAPALGLAAVGGAPLVGAAVAASGALLAVAVVALHSRRPRGAGLAAVAAVALPLTGLMVPVPVTPDAGRTAVVAAVQGSVPQAGLDFNARRRAVLDNHVRGTERLAERVGAGQGPSPDLVLWPENASDVDPFRDPAAAGEIQRAADVIDAPLLVGAVRRVQTPEGERLRNVGVVWGPDGPGASYTKRRLAAFGEYIPARSFFRRITDQVDLVGTDFAPGTRATTLPMGPARVGDVICFEVAYDAEVRDLVRGGADLLVVQTNNATFGFTDESVQQLAMSRVRAVESGRAVVHVSTVGVSAMIRPDGSTGPRTPLFEPAILHDELPLRTAQTLATRVGDWPGSVLVVGGLGLLAWGGRRDRGVSRPSVGSGRARAGGRPDV